MDEHRSPEAASAVDPERQRRVARFSEVVAESAVTLVARLDVEHVMMTAVDRLVSGFDARLARAWLFVPAERRLELAATAGHSAGARDDRPSTIELASTSEIATAARGGRPLVENAKAVLPLIVGGELRGVIAADFPAAVDPDLAHALVVFASVTTAALNASVVHGAEQAERRRFEDFVNGIDHGIVWEADAATLRITFVSTKAERLLGYPLASWYEEKHFWIDRVHPDDRGRVVAHLSDIATHDKDLGFEHRFVKADGEVIWVHTGARLAHIGPGAGRMIHGLSADISPTKAAEARASAGARQLDTILRGVTEGVTAQAADGRLVYANDAAARLSGFSSASELLATPGREIIQRFELLGDDGAPFPVDRLPGRIALQGRDSEEVVLRFRDLRTGEQRWSIVAARPILGADGAVEMVINVFRDVTRAKQTEQGLRFLTEASALLGSSLDYEATLRSLAQLAVPRIADWCSIHLALEGISGQPPFVVHADPEKTAWARALSEKYPPDLNAPRGAAQVLRSGKAELYTDIPDAVLEASARDEEHLRVLRALGMKSAMLVPLAARGRAFGVITFVAAESGRRYTEDDLDMALSLAERAAYAAENARLYSESIDARAGGPPQGRLLDHGVARAPYTPERNPRLGRVARQWPSERDSVGSEGARRHRAKRTSPAAHHRGHPRRVPHRARSASARPEAHRPGLRRGRSAGERRARGRCEGHLDRRRRV